MVKNNKKIKVAVALSGGIDSAMAAFLLKKKYEVVAVTMRHGCFAQTAVEKAGAIAEKMKIKHYIFDLEKEFKKEIIEPFCQEYLKGQTPNPCVWCNEKIKFGILLKKAEELGADYLATGHYARLRLRQKISKSKSQNPNLKIVYQLLKAKDKTRDQSYFLSRLNQDQLSKIIFPLGKLKKKKIIKIAQKNNLGLENQKESREICFIPANNYAKFLKNNFPQSFFSGPIKDIKGNILGTHQGLPFYTIGQRKGLIKGQLNPVYVVKIDIQNNILIVGEEKDLYSKNLIAGKIHWINKEAENIFRIKGKIKVKAKIRFGHSPAPAKIYFSTQDSLKQENNQEKIKVEFKKPQRAITPGQWAVFYSGRFSREVIASALILNRE